MTNLNLEKIKNIHLIGVGGVSMSGLASFLLNKGYNVSGSDLNKNKEVEKLIENNLKFYNSHQPSNINKNIELIVYSGAIKEDNSEIVKAKQLKIKTIERSEFLGAMSELFNNVLAVSGTHGKTTTTAYLSHIFMQSGLMPTIAIGGNLIGYSNFVIGKSDYLICEACEYRESFKYLKCSNAIITNVEADHLDYYKTFDNVKNAFKNFASNVKDKIITYKNEFLKNELASKVINCGDNESFEYSYKVILKNKNYAQFEIYNFSKRVGVFKINQVQEYNIKNAFLSVVLAMQYGLGYEIIRNGLLNFKGVERRNEIIGFLGLTPIIADYAHHPTEIMESLKGVKENYNNILCIFQPHTYSRTKSLKNELSKCFNIANEVWFFKTYPAREKYDKDGCERVLFNACTNENKQLFYDELKLFKGLKENLSKFDVVMVLGAGDLYDILKKILIK